MSVFKSGQFDDSELDAMEVIVISDVVDEDEFDSEGTEDEGSDGDEHKNVSVEDATDFGRSNYEVHRRIRGGLPESMRKVDGVSPEMLNLVGDVYHGYHRDDVGDQAE